jgi:threonyl-tRNA synthetase
MAMESDDNSNQTTNGASVEQGGVKPNDHRELNKRLQIFGYLQAQDGGVGLLTWLPNGEIVRQELEYFAKEMENKENYMRVSTPLLAPKKLYEMSGHHPYYRDGMYPPINVNGQELFLRPMNCPHHHMVARELLQRKNPPLRIAEFGHVYRYEPHGSVSGLMRARGFTQNDAHIYCTEDQVEAELISVLDMHRQYYEKFQIKNFYMALALPDKNNTKKFASDPDWEKSALVLKSALEKSSLPYLEEIGEAAFYGPKIDFIIESSSGANYTISTAQLDFMAAKRFVYLRDGKDQPLYVIHRAPLGSHERFIGFLLEHCNGKLPVWLAPTQAVIVPITDKHNDYAESVVTQALSQRVFNALGQIRISADVSRNHMKDKIKNAKATEVPYTVVVGDKEVAEQTLSVRFRNGENIVLKRDEFIDLLAQEINQREELMQKLERPAQKHQTTSKPFTL